MWWILPWLLFAGLLAAVLVSYQVWHRWQPPSPNANQVAGSGERVLTSSAPGPSGAKFEEES